jgi:hypothetical protein
VRPRRQGVPLHGPSTFALAAMRRVVFVFLSAVTLVAAASDDGLRWSHYSPELKLASVDSTRHIAKFSGQITVSGELVFTFEGDGNNGDLLWAQLIPDSGELGRLPQVVGGFYPGPLHDIWITPSDGALIMAFGRTKALYYSKGGSRFVSRRARVTLRDYTSSVECDRRGYIATIVRIEKQLQQAQLSNTRDDLHGC